MRKNRLSTEIFDSILRSAGAGNTKTQIMFASYTSYAQLKTYLSILLERGFLAYEPETRLYRTTPSGVAFLESVNQVREMLGEPKRSVELYSYARESDRDDLI
jgi:predicted transcriptional regulator